MARRTDCASIRTGELLVDISLQAACGGHAASCIILRTKNITERPEKPPLRGPVRDRKDDLGERPAVAVFQRLPEIRGRTARVIAERAATPRTQHQRGVSVRLCNSEHAINPLL